MARPVVTVGEVNRVRTVYEILRTTRHNGFPVVSKNGHLRGIILRKTLCSLLKLKAFSVPVLPSSGSLESLPSTTGDNTSSKESAAITPAATVFHDTLERTYPHYPAIEDIFLTPEEMVRSRKGIFIVLIVGSIRA